MKDLVVRSIKDALNRIRHIIPSPNYDFWKSRIACKFTLCRCGILKIAMPENSFYMYLPERTTQAKVLKFIWYVPWKGIYKKTKLALGNKNFNFCQNFKHPFCRDTPYRKVYKLTFGTFFLGGSIKKVHKSCFRVSWFEVFHVI